MHTEFLFSKSIRLLDGDKVENFNFDLWGTIHEISFKCAYTFYKLHMRNVYIKLQFFNSTEIYYKNKLKYIQKSLESACQRG